ncbi:MAG: FAD-dependent oxidoreductase [Clostridia bacterium]|nr:FAD-dependent oxidoreductase [Clostridia bacterium]
MESIWEKEITPRSFERLRGDLKTDVLIVGGGLAGLLCAYKLHEAGVDYALVEAKKIFSGTSGKSTAKITLQHGLIYDKLLRKYGKSFTRGYLNANLKAMDEYRTLCDGGECDLTERSAYVYSLENREKIEAEVRAYESLGINAHFCKNTELPFSVAGAVRIDGQLEINPLKLAEKISRGLNVYENTKVLELGKNEATVHGGKIRAKKIIIATHFPILNKHGLYPLKLYQHRSYVMALTGADTPSGMYVSDRRDGISIRDYNGHLILGGGAHRTGKEGGGWQALEDFAQKYYTGAHVAAKWAAQDCISLDGVAYIGEYSKRAKNLFVATGFNKWGLTTSMVAADLLCDLVTGKKNELAEIFSPSRSIFHKQLIVNITESVKGLLTPSAPRCPHLGCALKYNKAEHSWDCSCHGSRFGEDGEVIDNPATDDLRQ